MSALVHAIMEEIDCLSPRAGRGNVYESYINMLPLESQRPWSDGREGLVACLSGMSRDAVVRFAHANLFAGSIDVDTLAHATESPVASPEDYTLVEEMHPVESNCAVA
jgi:hypothetical protein